MQFSLVRLVIIVFDQPSDGYKFTTLHSTMVLGRSQYFLAAFITLDDLVGFGGCNLTLHALVRDSSPRWETSGSVYMADVYRSISATSKGSFAKFSVIISDKKTVC